jgi:membrane-bound ClpP family serine protease
VGAKAETAVQNEDNSRHGATPQQAQALADATAELPVAEPKEAPHWGVFVGEATPQQIKDRLAKEISEILGHHHLTHVCPLALIEPENSIDSFDLDKIFSALTETNSLKNKDVVLFLLSRGGDAEPAYQISKICKSFALNRFVAVIPRQAKSAATLVAIGADEIHMGLLGQLGPIDPQIGGLPALGVSQALKTIASVAQQYPGSAEMLARYLQLALTVEQIGYCERISESAVQYAERLLSTKPNLIPRAAAIAKELVHEYKDHGFVIDLEEARQHLGIDWIKTDTPELKAAEAIYSLFKTVNFFLGLAQSKRLIISGGANLPSSVLLLDTKAR